VVKVPPIRKPTVTVRPGKKPTVTVRPGKKPTIKVPPVKKPAVKVPPGKKPTVKVPPIKKPSVVAVKAHKYLYSPKEQVYYCPTRRKFFIRVKGSWKMVSKLPKSIKVDRKSAVSISLKTLEPYKFHAEVMRKHPPKKSGSSQEKDKGKGKKKK